MQRTLSSRVREVKPKYVMEITYSDSEIATLIQERKVLPNDWHYQLAKNGTVSVDGDNEYRFRIVAQQSDFNPLSFSAVLIVFPLHSSKDFLLRRYNGRSHRHKNRIEGTQIDGFHIHYATERYQLSGFGEEAYAKLTDRYANLNDALRCLLKDANFEEPVGAQLEIFQEV